MRREPPGPPSLVQHLRHRALVGGGRVAVRPAVALARHHQHPRPVARRRLQLEGDLGRHAHVARVADEQAGPPPRRAAAARDVHGVDVEPAPPADPEQDLGAARASSARRASTSANDSGQRQVMGDRVRAGCGSCCRRRAPPRPDPPRPRAWRWPPPARRPRARRARAARERARATAACTSSFSSQPKLETSPPLCPVMAQVEEQRVPAPRVEEGTFFTISMRERFRPWTRTTVPRACGAPTHQPFSGTPSAAWKATSSKGRPKLAGVRPAFSRSV